MKSIYEETGGTYTRQGDYEFPDLKVPPEKEIEIGVWGQRYRRYLKQHHRIRYYNLLTAGTLNGHLAEVDQQAERMYLSSPSTLLFWRNVFFIIWNAPIEKAMCAGLIFCVPPPRLQPMQPSF